MTFENTVSVITGAARGIGFEITRQLFMSGSTVVLLDLNEEDLARAEEKLGGPSLRIFWYGCNVADEARVDFVFKDIKSKIGSIDILVNNAGITKDNLFLRMKIEQWQQVLDVNLTGSFLCARSAASLLRKSSRGRIINLSSVAAKGNPGQANYAASKSGIIGLTKTLALELARYNVTVNAIAPGFIETEMTAVISEKAKEEWLSKIPAVRAGTVKDVASAVLFLASEDAAYITGQVLGVDGGLGI